MLPSWLHPINLFKVYVYSYVCIYALFALTYGKVKCGCRGRKRMLHPLELRITWCGCWCSRPARGPREEPRSLAHWAISPGSQPLSSKTESHRDRRIWLNLSPQRSKSSRAWVQSPGIQRYKEGTDSTRYSLASHSQWHAHAHRQNTDKINTWFILNTSNLKGDKGFFLGNA